MSQTMMWNSESLNLNLGTVASGKIDANKHEI